MRLLRVPDLIASTSRLHRFCVVWFAVGPEDRPWIRRARGITTCTIAAAAFSRAFTSNSAPDFLLAWVTLLSAVVAYVPPTVGRGAVFFLAAAVAGPSLWWAHAQNVGPAALSIVLALLTLILSGVYDIWQDGSEFVARWRSTPRYQRHLHRGIVVRWQHAAARRAPGSSYSLQLARP